MTTPVVKVRERGTVAGDSVDDGIVDDAVTSLLSASR